jgi:hypothetical protein
MHRMDLEHGFYFEDQRVGDDEVHLEMLIEESVSVSDGETHLPDEWKSLDR